MSEEILRALMQLFAIIAKQDDGVSAAKNAYVKEFLQTQFNSDLVAEYYDLYLSHFDEQELVGAQKENQKVKLTSVTDSVRIMGICKKINKTLQQQQKVIVYVRLLEFIKSDSSFTKQRVEIIETVAKVFRIAKEEIKSIGEFIESENTVNAIRDSDILVIGNPSDVDIESPLFIRDKSINGEISILRIPSVNLFFLRYNGTNQLLLNNKPVRITRVYLFAPGGVLRPGQGRSIYYSDINAKFLSERIDLSLHFDASDISYEFKNGKKGLYPMSIKESNGTLIGIMGASGAGKTTLLNVLSGQQAPSSGHIKINGTDLYKEKNKLEGVIGLVPQDDLLFEDLTVFENLYYNAKLCFKSLSNKEIEEKVEKVLYNLGLIDIRNLKVGSPLTKVISGGQRKRVNIALELIREPSVLFLDEPTSGLSSRDSENVMDLLRELSLKGKLVFVVIHQPSSTIFKLFDKLFVLDTGGYLIYSGNPVAAVSYFKELDHQLNYGEGECQTCGNVNPESVFDIIESKVVDEYGNTTDKRKVLPKDWYETFLKSTASDLSEDLLNKGNEIASVDSLPRTSKPNRFKQWVVFTLRDLKTKISNQQYLIITLTEAPALAFFLSLILRYVSVGEESYFLRLNDNIPAYIFVSIIVITFLGLMVSSEEIIKDRTILKREQFLNLSRFSYLLSKVGILFMISAIQAFLFVLIGNTILELNGQFFTFWIALFSVGAVANVLGLNISASFNSVVTIYILIPLLIIPQMVLSGAMFSFDRLNPSMGGGNGVPAIAHAMPAKWAYEGIMVNQFKHNNYNSLFFELDQQISYFDFRIAYTFPELKKAVQQLAVINQADKKDESTKKAVKDAVEFILKQLENEAINEPELFQKIIKKNLNKEYLSSVRDLETVEKIIFVLEDLERNYEEKFNQAFNQKEKILNSLNSDPKKSALLKNYKTNYTNEAVEEQVTNQASLINAFVVEDKEIIQLSDPVYQKGKFSRLNGLDAPFFSSKKGVGLFSLETFWFNILILLANILVLFIMLQFDLLRKFISLFGAIKIKKKS